MIRIEHLTKTFGDHQDQVHALSDVNLVIEKGDIFGIIGLSGAGKSTLVRCINRLEEPTSGEVYIEDVAMTRLNESELREKRKEIGMIFQHFNLLMNSTVEENIAFPLKLSKYPKDKIQKRVDELLEVVGLTEKRKSYPATLSGGQKQRVGIARALANDPKIILSDEATSALDPITTEAILQLLKEINRQYGITVVVITHEMDVIKKICNKVAVMENGAPVEVGSVLDVFSNPQSQTAKNFLEGELFHISEKTRTEGKSASQSASLLKISFRGDITDEPIIANIMKNYQVEVSILGGNIEEIQAVNLGYLVVKIQGDQQELEQVYQYLSSKSLRWEVL
ncbi:ATP-binding cassette domain-containing protein [Clostridiales bacterium COT073_COT-073]|nr:ATP-binding cassette domain-containing protein [Clostridiales bacterium COT073_COT-073]